MPIFDRHFPLPSETISLSTRHKIRYSHSLPIPDARNAKLANAAIVENAVFVWTWWNLAVPDVQSKRATCVSVFSRCCPWRRLVPIAGWTDGDRRPSCLYRKDRSVARVPALWWSVLWVVFIFWMLKRGRTSDRSFFFYWGGDDINFDFLGTFCIQILFVLLSICFFAIPIMNCIYER